MKRLLPTVIILTASLSGLSLIPFGQSANQSTKRTGNTQASSISGRIVNESGNPIPNVRVFVNGVGRQPMRRTINTDQEGRFIADDLSRGNYTISVQASGHVQARNSADSIYHKPGDTVNVTLKRGGVITGTVTASDGEPVVCVPITATQLLDEFGRRTGNTYGPSRFTDDRGVYRLFGLPAGTYIVAAASKAYRVGPPYDDNVPTYYPSSTRDSAAEVIVQYGVEASGIDIRFRSETGYTISGTLVDQIAAEGIGVAGTFSVAVMRASDDTMEAQSSQNSPRFRGNDTGFAISGVSDGDYYLIARRASYQGYVGAESKRVPVKVKGHDVNGLAINLVPFGSIAGRLTLDVATKNLKCETKVVPAVEESLISMSADDSNADDPPARFSFPAGSPDNQGDFVFQGLSPGRYRIDSRLLLEESWYIKTLTVPSPANTPVDVGGSGIIVRSGQRTSGVRVVLGQAAASVRGRVLTEKEGTSLPDRLRVYLVPSEQSSAEDLFRYIEADVQTDGSFKLLNAAPGKYWLMARLLPEEDLKMRIPRPQAWKSSNRAALRREASAANVPIELKPCQRVTDFQLRYSPPRENATPKRQ
jgi:hypothetical protein